MANILLAVWTSVCLIVIGICQSNAFKTLDHILVGDTNGCNDLCQELPGLWKSFNCRIRTPPTCTDGYENVEQSTMCLTDSPNFIAGSTGVSAADQAIIIQLHNQFRAGVNPEASSMSKIYWDDELARLAEKWAKQCFVGHESAIGASRFIPAYGMSPGQNGGFGHGSWSDCITSWHSEVADFQFNVDPNTYVVAGKPIGHYTQVVQEDAIRVGCGYAECSNSAYKETYFCNYLRGQYSWKKPYETGTPCSTCPDKCSGGKLCDCGDKFCFNSGVLNKNTCACECKGDWEGDDCTTAKCNGKTCLNSGSLEDTCECSCSGVFSGETCEILTCPAAENSACATTYTPDKCDYFINLVNYCPFLCGACPE